MIPIPTNTESVIDPRTGHMRPSWRQFLDGLRRQSGSGRSRRLGEFFWYCGATPPNYALVCDGSIVSRSTYADLWAFAQTSGNLAASEASKQAGQFGPGDGSTTFSLPDLVTGAAFPLLPCIVF